MQFHKESFK